MPDVEVIKQKEEIDLLDIVSILIKNIKWIISITIIFTIGIILYSIISIKLPPEKSYLPNEYSPKTIIMINNSENGGFSSMINNSGLGALAGFAGLQNNSMEISDSALAMRLVTTNSFISKINKEFNLDKIYKTNESDYPRYALKTLINNKLNISKDDMTGLLEISYTDIDKKLATKIVNKVTDLLEEEFYEIDKIRNKDQFLVVEDKKELVETELKLLQKKIINFQQKHNILDVKVVSEELVKLISGLQAQLLEKEVQIESYGKVANVNDPVYVRLLNERDAIIKSIKKLENGDVGDYPPLSEIPKLALELEELKRKLEIQMIGYKALIQQSETLKLTAEGTGSNFQVIEHAEIPEMKSGPSRGKLCIVVTFAGFFFSIFFVFVKEAWFNIKNDPDKMAKLRGEVL